jgi:hypothetical protein
MTDGDRWLGCIAAGYLALVTALSLSLCLGV